MELGGKIKRGAQTVEARPLLAYAGGKSFILTRWKHCRHRWWVLDYLNQGQQLQRVGRGKAFTRLSGIAALYTPGHDYYERQIANAAVEESYIMFDARGETETWLRQLAGAKGYCHFRDPQHLIRASLGRAAELVFHRRPGFHLLTHIALIDLLGWLVTAAPLAPNLRNVRREGSAAKRDDLTSAVERFIGDHIAAPVSVADLARHTKMSVSTFAHAYSQLAGESPFCTVRRLKLEAAKRFLLQDGLSVKECADRLGFSSEFHFSRLFKRLEGISPSHYRHALMEKVLEDQTPSHKLNRP